MAKKASSLDRILGRIESLDAINLTNLAQKLARERDYLETIFNTALEGILVVDQDGVIEYANESSLRLIGLQESELGSAVLWRLIPGLRSSLGMLDGEMLQDSISSRELEITYPEKRYIRIYILPFKEPIDVEAEEKQFVVILSDITSEKISKEETIESEKIASILLLAAGVAHELGNPLNSLTIHLQLLKRQLDRLDVSTPTSEKMQDSLEVCRGEVERLDGIIKNFLEAIRPQKPDFQVLNLHSILEEVLQFVGSELNDRGIAVEVEVESAPPIVRADKNQMKQVFFNLIKNAMEAMKPGGCLRVKTRDDEERIYLQFGDSGTGIKQSELSRVFEPYHTTKKGGSGLGLMIVQRIMREHGGLVGIDSQEGVGTVVTLEFPKRNRQVRMLEG
ncbi:ATP-binding protein [Pelagicoccus sp. SDUM812003]|uniref:two-component system sensor histidine kinase NtrB n=1 Tax=Pelagicoccus sp. SDUM812003 TaxID=3041267 RepID=UPI00280F1745|nr:ATP-binding protein [Pelagicoccus sp. SDUM812003]MDQ8204562.1 ATP-binding protein [Pelagicoccus sp. SDUM812003]